MIEINGKTIKIKQATRLGYIEIPMGASVADLSYPKSKLRRGRVQGERTNLSNYNNNRRIIRD